MNYVVFYTNRLNLKYGVSNATETETEAHQIAHKKNAGFFSHVMKWEVVKAHELSAREVEAEEKLQKFLEHEAAKAAAVANFSE